MNNKIFNKIWQQCEKYGLNFISSNAGTGKTTFFKFKLLKDALFHGKTFFIVTRYKNQMETQANVWLDIKPNYSKNKAKILEQCGVYKQNENFIYLVKKNEDGSCNENSKILAMFVNINNQAFYKPLNNNIGAERMFFDEVLAEDGAYCSSECTKFSRLLTTMARSNTNFRVYAMYNNTTPNFPYFSYFGGKSYNTHTTDCGARFIYFIAKQWSNTKKTIPNTSIQHILSNTGYAAIYNNNEFIQYPTYYEDADIKGYKHAFTLEIQGKKFKVKVLPNALYLDAHNANKRRKNDLTYSLDYSMETTIPLLPFEMRSCLVEWCKGRKIKTNQINDTIFAYYLYQRLGI